MFGSVMLDVAIGLILVYLILSFVSAALRESLEALLKNRQMFLHEGLCELLHDPGLTKDLYEHPLISSLYRGNYAGAKESKKLPSYIPSRNFALALLDMTVRGRNSAEPLGAGAGGSVMSVTTLRQNIGKLGSTKVQRVVLSALDVSAGDLAAVQKAIETWFDSGMDRVSGWYKRRSQRILVIVGLMIAALANVDTLRIAKSLYNDSGQRSAAIAMAGSLVKQPLPGMTPAPAPAAGAPAGGAPVTAPAPTAGDVAAVMAKLDGLRLPIGWPDPNFVDEWFMRLLGWFITGFAISLGAPFWFDLLSKIMTVRGTMKPPPQAATNDTPGDGDSSTSNIIHVTTGPLPGAAAAGAGPALAGIGGAAVPAGSDYRPQEWSSGHAQSGAL
jgi:hypothetical protein